VSFDTTRRRGVSLRPRPPNDTKALGSVRLHVVRHEGIDAPSLTCRSTRWPCVLPSRRPGSPPRRSVDWSVRLSSESLGVVVVDSLATVIVVGAPLALGWRCHRGWFLRAFSGQRRRQKREVRKVEPLCWLDFLTHLVGLLLHGSPLRAFFSRRRRYRRNGAHIPQERGGAADCVR